MRQKTNLRLQKKYNRLFKKLQQALQSGQFLTYSSAKKTRLLNRLQSYENRLLRKGIAVLGTAALLMSGGEVLAQQPVRVGEEFRVNTETNGNQVASKIALDSEGKSVIVWQSNEQDDSSFNIYGQRYDNDGNKIKSKFLINTRTTGNQIDPELAIDSDGDFAVVWQGDGQGESLYDIYGQRYNKNGDKVGNEFQINTETRDRQKNPSIAMDSDGNFVVVWQSRNQDGSQYGIYGQRYRNDGSEIGEEFKINTETSDSQYHPNIAMDSNGDFVVVWQSRGQDGSSFGIYGQSYDASGNKVRGEFKINTENNNYQGDPEVSMDSNGDFVVVWQSTDQDGSSTGVYGQRYDNNGINIKNEFQINTYTTSFQGRPSIALDMDGDFVVTWVSYGQDGSFNGIYAQYYDNNGNTKGNEFQVNTKTIDNQLNPNIAIYNDGDFIVTWTSKKQDEFSYSVYAQRYKIPTPTIPDINSLILNTCTRPYSAAFAPVPDAIGYQVQITVLARNGEVITRRIEENEISGNFNIPRRLLGTDVEIQIAAIFIDDETGEEVIGEFSESGTFTLGCDEADNLILESRNRALNAIQLSPNPVQSQLQVQVQGELAHSAELKILSLNGKVLLEQRQQLFEGQNELNLNVEQLATGTYFLQLLTQKGVEQVKFVKL